jgi:predicted transcriptional regulator
VRSGHARPEKKIAICAGSVSLAPEDRAELLTILAADSDQSVAQRAQNALLAQPIESFLIALARWDADPRFFSYCADNLAEKAGVADGLAKNSKVPSALVSRVAPHLTPAGIQAMLDDLDRLSFDPRLIDTLVASPAATPEQRALLQEAKQGAALKAEELEEAAVEAEPDKAKRQTLLQRLTRMNVVERIQLAVKGGREERMLLIRDPNKIVQRAVLQSPRLTDTEVESFSAMANVTDEVLRVISANRNFMKNYVIVKNLTKNPKTPLDISLRLIQRLTATDLKNLCANKNIPETLRTTAMKLQRQRSTAKPSS